MSNTEGWPEKNQKEWQEDCMITYGEVLTGEHCHWCNEWDGLPIDETCSEYEFCPGKEIV